MKTVSRLSTDNIKDIYTLSPLQEGIFFNWTLNPGSIAYFEQQSVRHFDELDIDMLKRSLQQLMERHDILRTVFIQKTTDRPIQVVLKGSDAAFCFYDFTGYDDKEDRIKEFKEADKSRSFNLNKDILIRLSVFKLHDEEYELIWSWHHILMDAWCVNSLKKEFQEIYMGLVTRGVVHLPVPVPYRNYIQWLQRQDKERSGKYWSGILEAYDHVTPMPFKRAGDSLQGDYDIKQLELELDEPLSASIGNALAELRVTQSTFFQTVWGLLLARYNNTRDAVFGIVVAGRPAEIEGVEDIIGLFINTVPVRIRFDEGTGFGDLLNEMQKKALDRDEHSYYPLAEIQARSGVRAQLFDHIFLFQNFVTEQTGGGTTPSREGQAKKVSRNEVFERYFYDFNVFVVPGARFKIIFKFNGHSYDTPDLEQTLRHFEYLIRAVAKDLRVPATTLSLLSKTEQQELVARFNPDADNALPVEGFASLFERQVSEGVAVRCMDVSLSYRELNNRTSALAAFLLQRNIGPGSRVGVLAHRSERVIIALVAILKAGACFVPADPETPAERLRYMFRNSDLDYLLTESDFLLGLSEVYSGGIFALDIQLDVLVETPFVTQQPGPEDLAYIIYTSGSTGKPKGVKIRQRSLVNYLLWANDYYFRNEQGHGFAFFTSLAFDLTLTSIFTTLIRGDTIWIYGQKDVNSTITEIFNSESGPNTVKLTPSHISLLQHLPVSKTAVQTVIVGGEALLTRHIGILKTLNKEIRIYNEYGPTEATVGCTIEEIQVETAVITIGRPIRNARIYILDADRHVMPPGVDGEIGIGGAGLAEGYLNHESLTKQKFVEDPFRAGERIYLTGDVGRWLSDGEIYYAGRKDDQVKINGFRIELTEIEAVAMSFAAIKECVCTIDHPRNTLVLYYRTDTGLPANDLTAYLQEYLPAYMVPGKFLAMDDFSLTANGKIDRRHLPDPFVQDPSSIIAPASLAEEQLLKIWKEVLESDDIGVEDKFFSIGGHSLKATQVASRILKDLKVKISLQDIFEFQTIRQLARVIERSSVVADENIMPIAPAGYYPLSYSQRRLWITSRIEDGDDLYTTPSEFEFDAAFDLRMFEKAIQALIGRHEILRTTFQLMDGQPVQVIHSFTKNCYKLDPKNIRPEDRLAMIEEDARKKFDLERGPLLRVSVLHTDKQRYLVLFSCHHIISDGWSLEVLIRDFTLLYRAFCADETPKLSPLSIQYKDYANWHNAMLEHGSSGMKRYWVTKLSDVRSQGRLPTDYTRRDKREASNSVYRFRIEKQALDSLTALSQAAGCTLFMSLLACIKVLMCRLSGEKDILVGTPVAGRVRKELEDQVGNYLNILVLRDIVDDGLSFKDLLRQVMQTTTEAYVHQLYPFDLLLEDLRYKRQKDRHPLFDVGLTLQNQVLPRAGGHSTENNGADGENRNYRGATTDLWFVAEQTTSDLVIDLNYDTSLFRRKTVLIFAEMLRSIINKVVIEPDVNLREIPIVDPKPLNTKLSIKFKM